MPTIAVTDETFQQEVLEAELPVLVDFWAEWCGPCKKVAPILEKLSGEYQGRLTIAKVDIDQNPRIAQALRIQSIPTMIIFSGGRPVDMTQGALPEPQLKQFLQQHLGPPIQNSGAVTVEQLAAMIEAGQPLTVVDIREPVDFRRSHLRRAQNISAEDFAERLKDLSGAVPVVVVCRTGEKSKEFVEANQEGASIPLMALEKGLLEWEGEGQPTYSDREEAALDTASV